MTTATQQATWQEWLRSQIANGRTRSEDLKEDFFDGIAPDGLPTGLFGNLTSARAALTGSGIGVASDSHGLEYFDLDDLEMAQDAFDLLRSSGNEMDARHLVRELRSKGYDATMQSVFMLPMVDTCMTGDLVETEGFRLIRGARRPR